MTVHEFDWPDRVVVGTVGRPGERTFYLQVRTGGRATSVVLEKQQSAALADLLEELLDDLSTDADHPVNVPLDTPLELVDEDPLDPPVDPLFRTGAMRLGWDPRTLQVVVEAFPLEEAEDERLGEPDEPGQVLRVRMPVGTARAFVQRTRGVVTAGRPECPRCGLPVDPDGHVCGPPDEA
ncbi:conserved hypothetical protein [Cellulomonas flavigena DSM 20109]|uniref:DUF3090 domain-containing protein n=1 Tax=Cellulomonas flavigena (strain ATCC 482 / DSM 20109 / BCRC 11376 / JCM 18109 / NBRC 3775 / NCIMB 8073 / NRS 134) TaxID=446466 RepID=D5UFS2_CELFN|nr:DUF3090 domain-containing protein [Cellulomonas flavigena]ADG73031.1 conserved hypothetical protein [Cellulomonas flavigena DSM 20109]